MTTIARILAESHIIAVVGLSIKEHRASHQVARYMQAHGYRIIPVNPTYAGRDIIGERCHATLADAAAAVAPARIDIVDCFRRSEQIVPIADEAVRIEARCLWLQLDIANPEAEHRARAAGLDVVTNRCLKIEHASLPDQGDV